MSNNKRSKKVPLIDNGGIPPSGKKKYVKKKRYPYKLYVPENLDIEEILERDIPSFKHHRDNFIYILHLIVSIPSRLKDYDYEAQKGFTPVNKSILSRRIHNYTDHIRFLVKHETIEEGTQYLPGINSRGLKYTEQYRTKVKGIYITKNTLIKSITELNEHRDIVAEKKLSFLKDWFNEKLTIDMKQAVKFLEEDKERARMKLEQMRAKSRKKRYPTTVEEVVTMGYNMKYIVADKINEGKAHHPIVDSTTGRFHSPLTQLKKGLREYVKYDGERLCSIDIVNSQPLLALIVLDYGLFMKNGINNLLAYYNPNHEELLQLNSLSRFVNSPSTTLVNLLKNAHRHKDVQQYKQAVIEGRFYEMFAELLIEKGLLSEEARKNPDEVRSFAKKAIFTAFFSRVKDAAWNPHIKAFKKCFPTVARIFDLIKSGNNHEALACLLQRFESNLVLHEACVEISDYYPHIPLFTIHDSIVTTEQYQIPVNEIFTRHLTERLGAEPKLKIEQW